MDENGELVTIQVPFSDSGKAQSLRMIKGGGEPIIDLRNGELCLNLNGMVAVKLVTLRITKTSGTKNLAKISSVEFLNEYCKYINIVIFKRRVL